MSSFKQQKQNKIMGLSKREANFLRLLHVRIKLRVIYDQLPKLPASTPSERLFRAVIRENIVIQFHNFIQIRNDLIEDPKIKIVDELIKLCWEPITKFQEPITQLRHNYLAHIQEDNRRFWFTNMIAVYSIFLAALAIIISLLIKT